MNAPIAHDPAAPRPGTYDRRALLVCGLWLRVAFIGASAAVAGLLELLAGNMGAVPALALIVAGMALAYASERRSRAALGRVGGQAPLATGSGLPDAAGQRMAEARAASGPQERRGASVAGQRLAGVLPKFSA